MEYQMRHYKIRPGTMAAFKDAWLKGVYRLRRKTGFDFVGVWGNDQTRDFVWILTYAGVEGLETADRRYYELDERKTMGPDPAQYIEPGGTRVMLTPITPRIDSDGVALGVVDHLADLHRRMRAVIDGLEPATLEAVPRVGENSLAVLVTHTIGSELGWLHRAAGVPFTRDRDAEFRARGSAESLASLIADAERRVPELVRAAVEAGASTPRQAGGERGERTVTVGYCIAHALSHGGEHVGHAELTRKLIA